MVEKNSGEKTRRHQKVARHAITKVTTAKQSSSAATNRRLGKRIGRAVAYMVIVLVCFIVAELLINGLLYVAVKWLHVPLLAIVSEAVLQMVLSLLVYALAVVMTLGVVHRLFHEKTRLADVGLAQVLPRWRDIGLAPLVFVGYIMLSGVFLQLITYLLPTLIDTGQQQAIGFSHITTRYELVAAYITLTVLAPFAEELLFRGVLFGKIRRYFGAIVTIGLTALLFASLHLIGVQDTGQVQLQWAVVCDTFILAIALGILREKTGSIWAGILLHAIKNSIAFFILFVAPLLNIAIPGM